MLVFYYGIIYTSIAIIYYARHVVAATNFFKDAINLSKGQLLITLPPRTTISAQHLFHYQPPIMPVSHDPIMDMHIQNKIADNLSLDAWEHVPRLPDHQVMVGIPTGNAAPPMHMVTTGGGATGVHDVIIDAPGGAITQTFYGRINPDTDDDDREDFMDDYDVDDDDEHHGRDDNNDDDDREDSHLNELDDVREKKKIWIRQKMMAPLTVVAAPRYHHPSVHRMSAALIHRPEMGQKQAGSVTSSPKLMLTTKVFRAIATTVKVRSVPRLQKLVVPQTLAILRPGGSRGNFANYRIIQVGNQSGYSHKSNHNKSLLFHRPLRVLYK